MNNSLRKIIGNIFILLSLLILTFIYLPYFSLYFLPPPIPIATANNTFSINIPKIQAAALIIENVNPWEPKVYQKALEKGVAQAEGSSLPGEKGTIFLFAHSSQPPWKITRLNTAFLRLGELKKNDPIVINHKGNEYHYLVTSKKEVWPTEVTYLQNLPHTKLQTLILQTCTPLGTSLKRLLVFAEEEKRL